MREAHEARPVLARGVGKDAGLVELVVPPEDVRLDLGRQDGRFERLDDAPPTLRRVDAAGGEDGQGRVPGEPRGEGLRLPRRVGGVVDVDEEDLRGGRNGVFAPLQEAVSSRRGGAGDVHGGDV